MTSKKPEDYLDDFFNEIVNDEKLSESVDEFTKRMKTSVNDFAAKSERYTDTINKGVSTAFDYLNRAIDYMDPKGSANEFQKPKEVINGITFVENELANIRYDIAHRGTYRDGHQEALRVYLAQMKRSPNNLLMFEKNIKEELKQRKKQKKHNERFFEGYNEGLEALLRILKDMKKFLMTQVQNDLSSNQ